MDRTEKVMRRSRYWLAGVCGLALLAGCNQSPSDGTAEPVAVSDGGSPVAAQTSTPDKTTQPLPAADSPAVQAAINGLMNAAYGAAHYDADRACWMLSFETPNDTLDYCMKPASPQVVASEDGPQVYVLAYSDPDAGMYSQVDPGLMGLLAASLKTDGSWAVLASSPAIDAGQSGDCACRDARLLQVGPSRYGWVSTEGGVWQGVAVQNYVIQVPVDGGFRNVSRIPRITEGKQDEINIIDVDRQGNAVAGMYPLRVTRKRGDAVVETRTVMFDAGTGVYPWRP
ncbi:MAG: hypothetical protein ACSLE1_16480 [Sphingobium sp.]